jgi:serine/threonine protein kinase
MSEAHHQIKKSKDPFEEDEQDDSNSSFDDMINDKIEKAKQYDSTPENNKGAAGRDKNGYVAETHENVHASGKKMRHEHDQKHTKHSKKDHRDNAEGRWDRKDNKKVVQAKPLKEELGDSFYEDSDSSEDEGLPDYKIGGYHPVHVGEVFKERYVIIQKLGWGHFSTVWLAKDRKHDTYVALKIQKSAQHYIEAAFDEVEILDQVSSFWKKKEWQESLKKYYREDPAKLKEIKESSKYCHTVQLLNAFMHHGPNGKHYVMVFEILGVNLLEIIKRYDYQGIPLHLVRELTKQCLIGLDYMNRICKLIHTDLKPENVVITLTRHELAQIKNKGVLKTTKMYNQNEQQIERAVAGANDGIILSSRQMDEDSNAKAGNDNQSESIMSKDWSEMTGKDKKKYRKRKRKLIRKYIQQGRLPQNYDDLEKDEKDKLYQVIRELVEQENLHRDELSSSKLDSTQKADNDNDEDTQTKEIDMENIEININASTKQGTETEVSKVEEHTPSKQQNAAETQPDNKKSNKSGRKARHSSVPGGNDFLDGDVEDKRDIEKLKQLMGEKMDASHNKPKVPKLNTNKLNTAEKVKAKVTNRGPKIDEDVNLAIVDMGNGCWTHHHFTSQIQTRQYRSPETIIGVPYGASADIWSLACMTFELLTGDFLFDPRKGYYYEKDDDHLAQMIELLGPMPKNFALSGKNSKRFFDSTAHLRRIRGLNYWPLHRVLTEKYKFVKKEAEGLADFLSQMLIWYPHKRATAQEMLEHPWLKMERNDEYKMETEEYETVMEQIKSKEETEKKKRELEIILREGSMDPETLSRKIRSENMSELAESNYEK